MVKCLYFHFDVTDIKFKSKLIIHKYMPVYERLSDLFKEILFNSKIYEVYMYTALEFVGLFVSTDLPYNSTIRHNNFHHQNVWHLTL